MLIQPMVCPGTTGVLEKTAIACHDSMNMEIEDIIFVYLVFSAAYVDRRHGLVAIPSCNNGS